MLTSPNERRPPRSPVYSTCLYCHASLGANEAIEHFPIARRLAFDAGKGRLWAICPRCQRWNLTPIEERWEAIEECERAFRDARLRQQTEHIGLARLQEGLDLVRIGQPLLPEIAAWRYGTQLLRRTRRSTVLLGGAAATVVGGAAVGAWTGVLSTGAISISLALPALYGVWLAAIAARAGHGRLRWLRIPKGDGHAWVVFGADIAETELVPGETEGEWGLRLRYVAGTVNLTGDPARRALGILMARVNSFGAGADLVHRAAALLAEQQTPDAYLAALAKRSHALSNDFPARKREYLRRFGTGGGWGYREPPWDAGSLPSLPVRERLALEMAIHDESERRAMAGEMAALEEAWRQAEEVAAIADSLLVPASVEARVREMRER